MQLKINKAGGFSSIHVLPPKYRRPTVFRSGPESSLTLARVQISSQLQQSLYTPMCVRKRPMVVHSGPEFLSISSQNATLISEESCGRSSFGVNNPLEPGNINAIGIACVLTVCFMSVAGNLVRRVFSGLKPRISEPFSNEDTITSGSNLEDKVVESGVTTTSIPTKKDRIVHIRNATLLSEVVTVMVSSDRHLFVIKFTIKVEDWEKVPIIMEVIKDMLRSNPHVLLDEMEEPLCYCSSMDGPHAATLTLECQLKGEKLVEGMEAENDLFLEALRIVQENGGKLASYVMN